MSDYCDYGELKRKLRKLKKFEKTIRQGYHCYNNGSLMRAESKFDLVWNDFFDLHEMNIQNVKYPISKIVAMDKDEYKDMVNEFLTL